MKKMLVYMCALLAPMAANAQEEIATSSQQLTVNTTVATAVPYSVDDAGEQFPVIWGLDTAWPDEWNMRRGTAFIGAENLGTARASFQPNNLITNGELSASQKAALDKRLNLIRYSGVTSIALNCDHEVLNKANYVGKPAEWVKLIEATARYCQSKGYTIVSVAPFNEPDYSSWGQGSQADMTEVARLLKENPYFQNIRICGANTLNCDQALPWYNAMKQYLDEGNTHQLAGVFNTYATFFETVRADGKHATADELHNVMEAMVGVEYGMQTGIWWGFDGLARGEFCRASNNGDRLAYAENRSTWTAASIYRNNKEGKVQAFLGTSERQANNASYRFISRDRDVYYDGYGPVRDFVVEMPGGIGYQQGQTNAERVVNITWGEDVQPYINGNYVIQNKGTGYILSLPLATSSAGANVVQKAQIQKAVYQQWSVQPVDSRIGGDFSYYSIRPLTNADISLDVLNSSLEHDANIIIYHSNNGAQQQWYLQYAGDGYFYIRSRQSTHCLKAGLGAGTPIKQATFTGEDNQKWRFVPADLKAETIAPKAPTSLTATSGLAHIRLDWAANAETDLRGYTILRAEVPQTAGEDTLFNTIARDITTCAFIDNKVLQGVDYLYKIKAQDQTGNSSPASDIVQAITTNEKGLVGKWQFDGNLLDESGNLLHGATDGSTFIYLPSLSISGESTAMLNGTSHFVQLPHEIASMREMTICTWVKWRTDTPWQRIFDFGNGTGHYMFLTPNGQNQLRFVMKNGGEEEILGTTKLSLNKWVHVAVTIADEAVTLYLDGKQVAQSTDMKIRPIDIRPTMNYIGRSQFSSDPLLKAYIDDFRIYNYALSAEELTAVTQDTAANSVQTGTMTPSPVVSTEFYTLGGVRLLQPIRGLHIVKYTHADGTVRTEVKRIQR